MSKKNTTDSNEPDFDLDAFLSGPDAPPKLEDKQLDALEAFLEKGQNNMHLEVMDGFFCGLICGPDATGPEPFTAFIFAGKEPEFASPAEEEEIRGYLDQHWRHIEGMLKSSELYYPFLYSDAEFKVSATEWALGFVLGLDKFRESWSDLLMQSQREENLLTPILKLYQENSPQNKDGPIHAEDREEIVTTLVDNLPKIYHHFDEAREKKQQNTMH